MKQTAVEWFFKYLDGVRIIDGYEYIKLKEAFEKAKEMEKNQIGKAFLNGRFKEIGQGVLFDMQPLSETFDKYYNETFKTE